MLKTFASTTGKLVLTIAVDVVKDIAANSDLSSSEKREAAFDRVKIELASHKVEVTNSLINTAIEIAVQNITD